MGEGSRGWTGASGKDLRGDTHPRFMEFCGALGVECRKRRAQREMETEFAKKVAFSGLILSDMATELTAQDYNY